MQDDRNPQQPGKPVRPGAWRLTFSYDGDRVELVSHQWVEMTAPPGRDAPVETDAPGFYVELRDGRNRVVYQHAMHSPIRTDAEVFSPNPNEPIRRVPVARPKGAFQVIVPDLPEGETVLLRGNEPSTATPATRARRRTIRSREYAKVSLRGEPGTPTTKRKP